MATEVQVMATTATAATAATVATRAKNPKVRKRAPKACLSCRARKVRCDVSQRGRPCMNCYLDSETCVVTSRASRLRKSQKPAATDTATATAGTEGVPDDESTSFLPPAFVSGDEVHSHHQHQHHHHPEESPSFDVESEVHRLSHDPDSLQSPESPDHVQVQAQAQANSHSHSHVHHQTKSGHDNDPATSHTGTAFGTGSDHHLWTSPPPPDMNGSTLGMGADITYSYYPFLAVSNLSGVLPQDVNYLELQGCLRVPTRGILDEFVQQYFLHVHPLLPLFHEGEFWDLYCQQGVGSVAPGGAMSLLVFQAMLFSTCNFVSRDSIRALGFPSIRAARAALYRRAKLLFDFETELSPAAIAQAALLLSFWSPFWTSSTAVKTPNTAWLSTAIQHAKIAEAHHYAALTAPRDARRANSLKRLWWCCILRDRIIGLGVRRSIQITRAHFDLDAHPPLVRADLADEIDCSRVYNPDTKSCLVEILVHMIELCVVLTDLLTLVFPLDDHPGWGRPLMADGDAANAARVHQCKTELRRWYKDVTLKFSRLGGAAASTSASAGGPAGLDTDHKFYHDSVILYTNLLYMYYHSSRVALCHHEMLHIAVAQANDTGTPTAIPPIYENRYELQDAASGVTECLKELVQLRLARWLPITAVACTALPLFLHILDVKLLSSSPSSSSSTTTTTTTPPQAVSSALKQHRLNILIEAMKTYQPQYDGVHLISDTIRNVINLAQLDGPAGISDWSDMLLSNPAWYLRMVLTMELALSKNRMPEERDFPVGLRGLFTGGTAASRGLLPDKDEPAVPPVTAASAPALHVATIGSAPLRPATPVGVDIDADLSAFVMSPHQLAVSMGAALGMDLDVDLSTDMDVDMDVNLGYLLGGTTGMTGMTGTAAASGMVTQLPSSDDGTASPTPTPSGSTDHDRLSTPGLSHNGSRNGSRSSTSASHLDAFSFDTDEATDDVGGSKSAVLAADHDSEWIRPAWGDDDGAEMREGDRDTARALLEAMGTE